MESNSHSFGVKVHRLIAKGIKELEWNYYLSVTWTKRERGLTLRTSCKSQYIVSFCTIFELVLLIPGLIFTPVVVKEHSDNISLVLIPGLKWICLWVSMILFQLPVYFYQHDLAQFFNLFLALDLSELAKGDL